MAEGIMRKVTEEEILREKAIARDKLLHMQASLERQRKRTEQKWREHKEQMRELEQSKREQEERMRELEQQRKEMNRQLEEKAQQLEEKNQQLEKLRRKLSASESGSEQKADVL